MDSTTILAFVACQSSGPRIIKTWDGITLQVSENVTQPFTTSIKKRGYRQMKALNIVIRQTVHKAITLLSDPASGNNGELTYYTLAYINRYMEPPGSDELKLAYERIENGQFDPPGFVPDCTKSEP